MTHTNKNPLPDQQNIGKTARWTAPNGLVFLVEITAAERSYGHDTYTVTPVAGEGSIKIRDIEVISET